MKRNKQTSAPMGKRGVACERNTRMMTPTIKKKIRGDGAVSARRAARSTIKRTPLRSKKEVSGDGAISAYGPARSTIKGAPLGRSELEKIDAYWRASLYLCVGMIYLKDNPLLRKPLKLDQTKARLLGHWGSDAGQSLVWSSFSGFRSN